MSRDSGGEGQNGQAVPADPAYTDVYLEIYIDPAPTPLTFSMTTGTLAPSKAPPGGFTFAVGGLAVQAAHTGNGIWEARLQPTEGYASGTATYQIAVIVETKGDYR